MTAVVAIVVFVFFDVQQVVTNVYDARPRTITVYIATAAVAAAEERRSIAEARAEAAVRTEAVKLTEEADGTINATRGSEGSGCGHSPAAPQCWCHPPLPSAS